MEQRLSKISGGDHLESCEALVTQGWDGSGDLFGFRIEGHLADRHASYAMHRRCPTARIEKVRIFHFIGESFCCGCDFPTMNDCKISSIFRRGGKM